MVAKPGEIDPVSESLGKFEALNTAFASQVAKLEKYVQTLEPRIRSLENWRAYLAGAWAISMIVISVLLKKIGCWIW